MTKPDKQMPDDIFLFPLDQDMVWCDTDESHEDDESYKYISEPKHLSEIAALEKKHREDMLALLDEVKCEIDDANWRYLHGYAGAVMPVNKIKAIIKL